MSDFPQPDPAARGWSVLHLLLGRAKMPRPAQPCDVDGVGRLAIGWPELRIGLAGPGDDVRPFATEGWAVFALTPEMLTAAGQMAALAETVAFERDVRSSRQDAVRTTSNDEDVVARALLAAGVGIGERNYNFRDGGRIITTPDFAWPERMVALFVDGLFWHGGSDVRNAVLAAGAQDAAKAKQLSKTAKDTASADAAKRRRMTAAGWAVLVITDAELKDPGALDDVVAQIAGLLAQRPLTTTAAEPAPPAARAPEPEPFVDEADDEESFMPFSPEPDDDGPVLVAEPEPVPVVNAAPVSNAERLRNKVRRFAQANHQSRMDALNRED